MGITGPCAALDNCIVKPTDSSATGPNPLGQGLDTARWTMGALNVQVTRDS